MKSYLSKLIIMAAVVAGLMLLIHGAFGVAVSVWSWMALGFFFGLNLLTHFLSISMLKSSQKSFLTFMYGSIGLRFIFSIGLCVFHQ